MIAHAKGPCPVSNQTRLEEIFNSITHGVGALLSLVGLILCIIYASMYGTALHVISCTIYGATMLLLYTSSTWYHWCRSFPMKRYLQKLDHIAIALFIAGSYTPFALITLNGAWGWSIFTMIWCLAAVAFFIALFFAGKSDLLSAGIYLLMGWIIVVAIIPLVRSLDLGGSVLLFSGGMAYSIGTIFYLWEKIPFNHPIWHLFVLAGSICHFFAIFFYVLPG
jgi:hemolysin III